MGIREEQHAAPGGKLLDQLHVQILMMGEMGIGRFTHHVLFTDEVELGVGVEFVDQRSPVLCIVGLQQFFGQAVDQVEKEMVLQVDIFDAQLITHFPRSEMSSHVPFLFLDNVESSIDTLERSRSPVEERSILAVLVDCRKLGPGAHE